MLQLSPEFGVYSPIPADQLLRQNVVNYFERERPLEIDEHLSEAGPGTTRNGANVRKRKADEVLYSYIKKPCKGPQSKLIRLQIFDVDEIKNIENLKCHCEASVCAQHIVDYTFSDDVYKCAKDLLHKMCKKLI